MSQPGNKLTRRDTLSASSTYLGADTNNKSNFTPSCENLTQRQDQHLLGQGHFHRQQELDAVSQVAGCGYSQMGPVSVPAIPIGLKRRVGLFSGIALIVGTMIGSGIFLSPRGVLERSGSVGLSLVVWGLSGLLSLLGALCYAELGTLISKSGAEYSYILEAFGGPLAFLFSWISVFILKPAMLSIICLTLSEYIVSPLFEACPQSTLLIKLFTIFSIVTITYLNCYSVNLATGTQNLFTGAKLIAIFIVISGGLVRIAQGEVKYISRGFEGSKTSFSDIATAFYTSMWAYDGWNNLNYVTEELINPYRNLPLAIIYGIPVVTACYVLVNISYLTVMSPEEILTSDAVAVTWGNHVLGFAAFIIPISVVVSSFGAGNGSCFTSGRLSFAAARENHLPDILAYIHVNKYTPSPALIFNAILAISYVIPGNIDSLIDFFSFTAWLFYGLTMLALIRLRYKAPWKDKHRPYKVHLSIPVFVFIVSMYFVIAPILEDPQIEYLYVTIYILSGFLAYFFFVMNKFRIKSLGTAAWTLKPILKVIEKGTGSSSSQQVVKETIYILPPNMRNWIAIAGLMGASAVALGAYGSHVVYPKKEIEDRRKAVFETANKYHFIHTLALVTVPFARKSSLAGGLFLTGTLIFSGSCYYYAITDNAKVSKYAPYGGITLILAWLSLGF